MPFKTEPQMLKELAVLFSVVERDIMRSLRKLDREGLGSADATALRNSVMIRAEIRQKLDNAGAVYQELLTENVVNVAKSVIQEDPMMPNVFEASSAQAIENAETGLLDQVSMVFGEGSQSVRSVMMNGLIGGRDMGLVIKDMQKRLDVTHTYAKTITTTALHSAARAATVEVADESDIDFVYTYTGPDDKRTRPFCQFWGFPFGPDSKVAYTREAIKALSKDPNQVGQPGGASGDVAAFGGGFNCRHNWNAKPFFIAKRDGYEIRDEDFVRALISGGGSRKLGTTT